MSDVFQSPVMLKFRGDREHDMILAWFTMTDGSGEFLASSMSMRLADDDRQNFEDWKAAVIEIHKRWLEKLSGLKVIQVDAHRPHEAN